jgi:multidrug resistance efflux pump
MNTKRSGTDHIRKRYLLRHLLPAVVWLVAVSAVVWLFYQREQQFQVVGIAQERVRQVAADCPGRIKDVRVQLFERVAEGQVVAVIDTVLDNDYEEETLRAQLGRISAEIERLAAELVPTQDDLQADRAGREANRISDLRRFSVDVENIRLRILDLKVQLLDGRSRLQDLASDVKIAEDLVQKEALAPLELEKAKAQYEMLAKAVAENEQLLQQTEANLAKSQERLEAYASHEPYNPSIESALEVIRKGIAVQESQMKAVSVQLEALKKRHGLELTAPVEGVVSHVWKGAGEVVTAGDPIVTIAKVRSAEVIGYANETQAGMIHENMTVEVVKATEPMQVAPSTVTYVGPMMEQIPAQLWRNPNVPQWGRPFKVELPPDMAVIPGETVGIRGL